MQNSASKGIGGTVPQPGIDPLFFEFRVGDLRCLSLSEGYVDGPAKLLAPEVPSEELSAFLVGCGEPADLARTPISCLVVCDYPGVGHILVDAGMGKQRGASPAPSPTVDRLPIALGEAGITQESIQAVLVSHIHPDHIGGLFDSNGRPVYPNAVYHVPQEEIVFWGGAPDLGGTLMPPPAGGSVIGAAQGFLRFAGDRIRPFASGEQLIPGIGSMALPGHTPGQVGFVFRSGSETLFYTADAAGHSFVSLQHPEWRFSFDSDPELAKRTRKALVEQLVREGWTSFTPHFPWPAVGRVRDEGGTPVFKARRCRQDSWTQRPSLGIIPE